MKLGALEAGGTKMVCAIGDETGKIWNGQIQEIYDQKDFSRLPEHTPWLHLYQKTYGNRSEDKK